MPENGILVGKFLENEVDTVKFIFYNKFILTVSRFEMH